MSYIRCTSNPEGLYVYHSGDSFTYWHSNQHPMGTPTPKIPAQTFHTFCRRVMRNNMHDDYAWKGIRIEELWEDSKGRLYKEPPATKGRKGAFKYVLTYKGKHVATMWEVTWFYILNQNAVRWKGCR